MADFGAEIVSSKDRLARALQLGWPNEGPSDVLGALALFDPAIDADDGDWCNVAAILYNDPKVRTYDKNKALYYWSRAMALGSAAAFYNVAASAERGYYGKIDQRRARVLFKKAAERGHMCAGAAVYQYLSQDPRYGREGEEAFTDEADDFLAVSAARRGPWALERFAALNAGQPEDKDATARMIKLYEALIEGNDLVGCKTAKPRSVAARRMAMRAYLGIDVPWNFTQARAYLDAIPKDHWDVSVKYGARNFADKMLYNLDRYADPACKEKPAGSNAPSDWDMMVEAGQSIIALYTGRDTFEAFKQRLARKETLPSAELVDQLGFVASLAREEGWLTRRAWASLLVGAQTALADIPVETIQASTRLTGPEYNVVEPSTGYEVPGALLKAAPRTATYSGERGAPPPGIARFDGLDGLRSGDIRFNFTHDPSAPAMILDEDVEVCMCLAFGDPKGVVWPGFSLESVAKMVPEAVRWVFERKDWQPGWLGRTAFGRTLYFVDVFLGRLWSASSFDWEPERLGVSKAVADRARYLIDELALAGGRDDGLWSRVMLAPKTVDLEWADFAEPARSWNPFAKASSGSVAVECRVQNVTMRVEGSNCVCDTDGTEIRDMNLDDPDYSAGRIAVLMTGFYDELAVIFPLLERSRQLMGLQHALFGLRARGFALNDRLQSKVTAGLESYRSASDLPMSERLVWR